MPAFAGPLYVFSALIVVAGAMKVIEPATTSGALRQSGLPGSTIAVRALGVGEVAVGILAIATGSTLSAWLVAAAYVGFTAFVVNALVRELPVGSCGCFGKEDTPPTWIHVGITTLGAGFAAAAAFFPPGDPGDVLTGAGGSAVPFFLFVGIALAFGYMSLTTLPKTLGAAKRP